ncbi:hypothetical protein [Kushneria aurantia]|uniref:Uncharacterized protein n=1 Tax=Kushneria aurantia TaxID=504092 RepID=A0ABV6G3N7_9GAMM|nr:hypothetical protein [Kushneria aurantia]
MSHAFRTPDRRSRQARLAVTALFFTNGVMITTLMPRYPELKQSLSLSIAACMVCASSDAKAVPFSTPSTPPGASAPSAEVCWAV